MLEMGMKMTADMLNADGIIKTQANSIQNRFLFVQPSTDPQYENKSSDWKIFSGSMRWDLLNPGTPHLVPINLLLTKFGEATTLDEIGERTVPMLYNRRDKRLVGALNLSEFKDAEGMPTVCIDMQKAEWVMPSEDENKAVKKFAYFSMFKSASEFAEEENMPALREFMADLIGITAKELALI